MNPQEVENLYIHSLDAQLTPVEREQLVSALQNDASLAKSLSGHDQLRAVLLRAAPASFDHFFATRLMSRIENTGVIIERQIFSFFKKYQLVAAGIIVALLILNTLLSDQVSAGAVLGLDNSAPATTDEIVSFDFYNTLTTDL